jgi:hypothetical protein
MSGRSFESPCGKDSGFATWRKAPVRAHWSRGLFAALAAALLSSCANGAFYFGAYTPADWTPKENREYGVLLVSMGLGESVRDYSYVLDFRRTGSSGGAIGTLTYPPRGGTSSQPQKIEFKDGARHGVIVQFPLVPGEYEIFRYGAQFSPTDGYTYVTWASKEGFSIPFSIVAGRTTYLGEIMLDPGGRADPAAGIVKSFDGKGIFSVSDKLARDLDLAEQAGRPVIRANPLKEIPDPKELRLDDFRTDNP